MGTRRRLESERLVLEPFAPPDANELLTLFQEPSVREFLLDDALVTRDWVDDEIVASAASFEQSSAGLWKLRLIGECPIVGFAGFREFFDPPQLQLLYGVHPDFEGRGFATESARAACDYAFDILGHDRILAATDVPNTRSIRVLERLGFTHEGTTTDGDAGTLFFSVTRSELQARYE